MNTPRPRVLLAEDDEAIRIALADKLAIEGFTVTAVVDGHAAWTELTRTPFALVLLDVMLPGIDGLELCRRLRETGAKVPVLILTARGLESDRVLGLEVGADDYIVKPFSARELVARMRAILRRQDYEREAARSVAPAAQLLRAGCVVLDRAAFRVRIDEREIDLSPTECDVLALLIERHGQVVTRARLLEKVWGLTHCSTRTIDFHIRQLRLKLELDPAQPLLLQTVHGVGYRLDASTHPTS